MINDEWSIQDFTQYVHLDLMNKKQPWNRLLIDYTLQSNALQTITG